MSARNAAAGCPRRAPDRHHARGVLAAALAVGAAVVCGLAPSSAAGQGAQGWTAEARVGRLDFRLAPAGAPPATSVSVGLGFAASDVRFGLSAGIPLGEEDPLWGAADLRDRSSLALGAVTLGLDAVGQAFAQRYTRTVELPGGPLRPPTSTDEPVYGWGVAAQALPFARFDAGALSVEARAGASFYHSALEELSASRTVGLAELRGTFAPSRAVALTADAAHFTAEDGDWTRVGVGALVVLPGVELQGTVGHWLNDSIAAVPWSAGVALRLAERLDLLVDGRQEALDPLYGSSPRRSWSAALRVRLADAPSPAEPVPAAYDGATATIVLPASDAGEAPRIAGDFTGWEPRAMARRGDRWEWRGRLEPGVYEYAFVGPDGEWFVPESVPGRKDDGMGGSVALLVVEESS